jgi:hypothetical protein
VGNHSATRRSGGIAVLSHWHKVSFLARGKVWGSTLALAIGIPLVFSISCADQSMTPTETVVRSVARRSQTAPSGSEFVKSIKGLNQDQIEAAILREAKRGNMPNFLRKLSRVRVSGQTPDGKLLEGIIYVAKDYFAIGTDQDFVRVPMNPMTAQKVATSLGFVLPTTKVVDEVFRQADIKVRPSPMTPGKWMSSVNYFSRHNDVIESQLRQYPYRKLTAGQKKDIVITNRLIRMPKRVAIYGWHKGIGAPIQPLSTVHDNRYADYSHGVRLVWNMMEVNGKQMSVTSVLKSKIYSSLLSNEGPIGRPKILFANQDFSEIGDKIVQDFMIEGRGAH